LNNMFDNATKQSKKKMLLIALDHDSRLEAGSDDPDIEEIYNLTHPDVLNYQTLMAQWESGKGIGKSRTRTWEELLDDIQESTLDIWEGKVTNFFPKNTPTYLAIFPNGRTAITNGKYEERLLALDAFSLTLGNYVQLASLKTEVDAKITEIKAARNQQRVQYGKVSMKSNEVEQARVALADLFDNNLCKLKIKYRKNLSIVENYFDLSLLRKNVTDDDFQFQTTGTVEAGVSFLVAMPKKLELSTNAICNCTNLSGVAEMQFFFAANGASLDNAVKITVQPDESVETTAAEAGWAPGMNFVVVKNLGDVSAEFELNVVAALEQTNGGE
jgi:hypothetical protein